MNIHFDFPLVLTTLVVITGFLTLIELLLLRNKRRRRNRKISPIFEYSKSFFPMLLIVLVVRSFIVQPYRVPSGSLLPTVLPGDFIAVNQFAYGLRFPIGGYKFFSIGDPKRGDIVLFHWPRDPKIIFVKRVIGLPGDHILYKNKTLTINGIKAKQKFLHKDLSIAPNRLPVPVLRKSEDLLGINHQIFVRETDGTENFDIKVPDGHYFMMGDNRDDSDDSRYWGFVPEENLIGKAILIWMSFDSENYQLRWRRIGEML